MSKNIVVPMAGAGSRFSKIGIETPKPLIHVAGQEALLHALASLPILPGDHLILIALRSHKIRQKIAEKIQQRYFRTTIEWVEIEDVTEGQLCTVLLAKEWIDQDKPLLIHNCDTAFRSNLTEMMKTPNIDGVISCLQADGHHWSFAKVNDDGVVIETAEKERISPWASVGLYYFSSGRSFVEFAQKRVDTQQRNQGEYYIAPLYNDMIQAGHKIMLDKVEWFQSMGTPEDLKSYWGIDVAQDYQKSMPQTLVVDLDGTLCTIKQPYETYADVQPIPAMVEKIRVYKNNGFRIVIQTARHMKTCKNNVGKVTAQVGAITLQWLKRHDVPYDEVCFGKPWGHRVMYIDDKAIRPDEFVMKSYEELQELTNRTYFQSAGALIEKGETYAS